jgi:hypothetical protein
MQSGAVAVRVPYRHAPIHASQMRAVATRTGRYAIRRVAMRQNGLAAAEQLIDHIGNYGQRK